MTERQTPPTVEEIEQAIKERNTFDWVVLLKRLRDLLKSGDALLSRHDREGAA